MSNLFISEVNEDEIAGLEEKLRDFYHNSTDYTVFDEMTWKPDFWEVVVEQMKKIEGGAGRFLEIGAAKSGFAEYLRKNGLQYEVAFHDVTPRCSDHLSQYTKELYFGSVENIEGKKFDVIFHSYVFEHVTRPRSLLKAVDRLLEPNGAHVIECPRYDVPIYIPPSIRHNDKSTIAMYVAEAVLDRHSDFSVVSNPAVLTREFRRDADAVHRVTKCAVKRYAYDNGLDYAEFRPNRQRPLRNLIESATRLRVVLKKKKSSAREIAVDVPRAKMRISIVLGPFLSLPPNPSGAVEKMWGDLAEKFSQLGHRVTLVGKRLPKNGDSSVRYLTDRGEERTGRILKDIVLDAKYANRVADLVEDSDIVVTNSFSLPIVLNGRKRKGADFKIVVNLARMPKGQLFLYRGVDQIAVVSKTVLNAVEKENRSAFQKSVVVPNPIDCGIFNTVGRKSQKGREREILFAGRIAREKGVGILVDVFRLLPKNSQYDYHLKIVGPHLSVEGGDGESYLEELKLSANGAKISFLPPVWDRRELAKMYRQADIFVYPSISISGETFGISPLEAMACGAATVVSDLECFTQFVIERENALVAKILGRRNAAEILRDRIVELEKTSLYRVLQKEGIRSAKAFDTSVCATKYLRVFGLLMKKEEKNEQ